MAAARVPPAKGARSSPQGPPAPHRPPPRARARAGARPPAAVAAAPPAPTVAEARSSPAMGSEAVDFLREPVGLSDGSIGVAFARALDPVRARAPSPCCPHLLTRARALTERALTRARARHRPGRAEHPRGVPARAQLPRGVGLPGLRGRARRGGGTRRALASAEATGAPGARARARFQGAARRERPPPPQHTHTHTHFHPPTSRACAPPLAPFCHSHSTTHAHPRHTDV